MKRFFIFLLLLALLAGVFSGCGNPDQTQERQDLLFTALAPVFSAPHPDYEAFIQQSVTQIGPGSEDPTEAQQAAAAEAYQTMLQAMADAGDNLLTVEQLESWWSDMLLQFQVVCYNQGSQTQLQAVTLTPGEDGDVYDFSLTVTVAKGESDQEVLVTGRAYFNPDDTIASLLFQDGLQELAEAAR